tara:strand:- start:5473 stop:5898 length:426 start_codon:yes stop_codon:yes gene_type:complete
MQKILNIEKDIIDEFSFFEDWMDKYAHLISLGKDLKQMSETNRSNENKIKGCQSQVWLNASLNEKTVQFEADSDAVITKGMIALLLRVVNGQSPKEIASCEFKFLEEIGLTTHLSPSRANGLLSMVKQIRLYGVAFQGRRK